MKRDPRVDPQPGDVLIAGPQWQSERYEVISRDALGIVWSYWKGQIQHVSSVVEWKHLMKGAEVLHVAD